MLGFKKIDKYIINLDLQLGKGSFGKVYQGIQDKTNAKVAVKMLDKKSIQKDQYIQKALFEEIKILGLLKSDNIVKFIQVMQSPNYYYIVQELCTGGDLRKVLTTRKVIPQAQAVNMLKQICNGFVALIKQGIIHRDLKPQNILINKGILKICDFGFSKRLNNTNVKNSTILGTPLYKSLELLKAKQYTGKCDIWALGCIFYEMLHGVTPWTATSQYDLVINITNQPLLINPKLSHNVKCILKSMLTLDQKNRIDWDQLLRHSLFQNHFNNYVAMNQSFENKIKYIMNNLRYIIRSQNIDLQRLFNTRGYSKYSQLTFEDFKQFLSTVGLVIQPEQARYAFEKIDKNNSNTISLSQLQQMLQNHHIPFRTVLSAPYTLKKKDLNNQSIQNITVFDQFQQKVQDKLIQIFKRLDQRMIKQNTILWQVYDAYDIDRNGDISLNQFNKLIKNFNSKLTQKQITTCFKIIDLNRNGGISFEQLNRYFCKCVGIAYKTQGKIW